MRFRDPKTGEMCGLQGLLLAWIRFRMHHDTDWAKENVEEVARLMGYEVVEDDGYFTENERKSYRDMLNRGGKPTGNNIEDLMGEANMDKPLKDWTAGEISAYCKDHAAEDNICMSCELQKNIGCCPFECSPADWDLKDNPRFTEQDVEDAKAVKRVFGRDGTVKRLNKAITDPYSNLTFDNMYINESMFPCIFEGQSYTLDEIIGGAK